MASDLLFLEPDIGAITEFEAFNDDPLESTTSSSYVTKNNFPFTSEVKTPGNFVIEFSAQIGQSDKEKTVGFRASWREGTSGPFIVLADLNNGLSTDDGFELRTGFNIITLTTETVIQINLEWGQITEGGTGRIQFAAVLLAKVTEAP